MVLHQKKRTDRRLPVLTHSGTTAELETTLILGPTGNNSECLADNLTIVKKHPNEQPERRTTDHAFS